MKKQGASISSFEDARRVVESSSAFGCSCVVVGIVVVCLLVYFFLGVGLRLKDFGFVGGESRFVPIVCVGQPSTSDETRAFLGY